MQSLINVNRSISTLLIIITISTLLCACSFITFSNSNPNTNSVIHHNSLENKLTSTPNILFIYTDDQAPWALGRSGNKQALTPHLDKLASQGMYLPNAYSTTPVCSPSRASLLTSQYGYELDIDDWIKTNKAKTLSGNQPNLGLKSQYETWPEVLQGAGYITGLIGKWHLGERDEHIPTKHGYSEFVGFRKGGTTPKNPVLEVHGKTQKTEGLTTDILTQYAIDFMSKNRDKPFALSLHYRAPHYRFLPVAPEDSAPYENMEIKLPHPNYPDLDTKRAKQLMRGYLSSVRGIDRNVGRLMTSLKTLGIADNTLVIFTSDHGYNIGHNGMWHKGNGFWLLNAANKGTDNVPNGQRPNMYDNSIKVPTIVRWPGVIKANSINNTTVSNLDWFPTIVSLANGTISQKNIIRGKNIVPALLDEKKVLSTDYYAAYSTLHQTITHMRMYSDGKFKLIRDFKNTDRDEFYDLEKDPQETTNLITAGLSVKHLHRVNEFKQIILNTMRSTNDPVVKTVKDNINNKNHSPQNTFNNKVKHAIQK